MTPRKILLMAAAVSAVAAMGLVGWAAQDARTAEDPPVVSFHYGLFVEGALLSTFRDMNLTSGYETGELELKPGKLGVPGSRKPPALVLTRGLTGDQSLSTWHEDALARGTAAAKNAELVVFDQTATPVARYQLTNAWPSKLELRTVQEGTSTLLLETVTIVSEKLQRVAP